MENPTSQMIRYSCDMKKDNKILSKTMSFFIGCFFSSYIIIKVIKHLLWKNAPKIFFVKYMIGYKKVEIYGTCFSDERFLKNMVFSWIPKKSISLNFWPGTILCPTSIFNSIINFEKGLANHIHRSNSTLIKIILSQSN